MNNISQDQLQKLQLDRLAAQRQLYTKAKGVQVIQIIIAVPCVIIWSLLIRWIPNLKVYGAFWGIAVTLFDIYCLSPWVHSLLQKAAKIQELFDCDVLQLDWQDLKVGHHPDEETIVKYSSQFKRTDPECLTLRDWYPSNVGKLPTYLARILCQRINCWWDGNLRRRYALYIVILVAILTMVVFLIGVIGGFTIEKFILAILAPLMPLLVLGMRQYREHNNAAATSDHLKKYSEDLWQKALLCEATVEEFTLKSRCLQCEIYDLRRKNPLIFDWIYQRLRGDYQEQMNKAVDNFVTKALQSLSKDKHAGQIVN